MSVTLETLCADFAAQRIRRLENIAIQHDTTPERAAAGDRPARQYMDADFAARLPVERLRKMPDAMLGAIYVIARDYGLEAALLWKLANGGAL
ncbi:MAG: hypothetical protein AABZ76_16300 [Pseudomonadota bacterium]